MDEDTPLSAHVFQLQKKSVQVSHTLKDLLSPDSFPMKAINAVSEWQVETQFINYFKPEDLNKKTAVEKTESTFRTPNRYLLMRSTIGGLYRLRQKPPTRLLSKITSSLWKKSSKNTHAYYEYLAQNHAAWHEHYMRYEKISTRKWRPVDFKKQCLTFKITIRNSRKLNQLKSVES
ncbi:hypothetical protein DIURU_001637 [Diutina rugosa]|uniref:Uncharacterized protein n=1 Tax=Diutina rugosa TaxID=5481 RepID=A0A642UYD3_DIURU|nr:uncharacterized protein DIURU_001637 [Diutina rugosa]KAA8905209.1 hypothetical protein DIURU_001637 [Diutina rugosa]